MLTFLLITAPASIFGTVLLVPTLIIIHATRRTDSRALPFVHVPSVLLLYVLMTANVGRAHSLGNIVEFFIVGLTVAVVIYSKLFLIDRFYGNPRRNTYLCVPIIAAVTLVIRLTMPAIAE